MRQSNLLLTTLREVPSEAETNSHQLLLRAGYIRQLAAGVYTYLPLGRRVLRKIEAIVREEMDHSGTQEILMPSMQPAELWKKSERYDVYGKELMTFKDRHEREFILGPTHEEVVTTLVRNEISSYRKLPVTVYQIQTKFRDERRPRSGLLRGREFLMKDAYSFDISSEGLDKSYHQMFDAYHRIFKRCGLKFRAVHADSGAIGGEGGSHEFMALADIGEDTIAVCSSCDYAANLEQAEAVRPVKKEMNFEVPAIEKFHTPNLRTIDQLEQELEIQPEQIMKTLIYEGSGQFFAVVVRGDHEVNEIKVSKYIGAMEIKLADYEAVKTLTGVESGFVGPVGLQLTVLVDAAVAEMTEGTTGAGEKDYHFRNVVPGRDFGLEHVGDFRNVAEGEACPHCEDGVLHFHQGIEIGHVFKLGTKYSEKLGASFLDRSGKSQPMIMGCYGIGISRLLSAIVEQNHDDQGIMWPVALAPYQVHILMMSIKDSEQLEVAEELYNQLTKLGIETLLDDRDERAGVKFKDSSLIGIPVTLVVGKEAAQGRVEYLERASAAGKEVLEKFEAVSRIQEFFSQLN
ncbi:proline--tRNA ligase [Paenibacillus sp. B2(2019)]|uniref:proline--tRNA ligase n=1 Tax=Paenibacillus sp. B2(2019) TaxID=2607754 RepID=UPI0011F35C19|nr:proline--tRNA ligase [Paenibacillus sp. B2(2019)]KAA1180818.1 proline--tRNA ligase [Paenibacillus sp. B2(2019)]